MIRVGITGQAGFIGGHLYNWLHTKKDEIEVIDFKRTFFLDSEKEELESFVGSCDVIIHLAAMNRADDPNQIYDINVGLTQNLIDACDNSDNKPHIFFSSSTQEEKNNHYGKSKRKSRQLLEEYALRSNAGVTSFIIPNVFGPFGLPNYNSFIATFCHKLVSGETPEIIEDAPIGLIYVQELVDEFYKVLTLRQNVVKKLEVQPTTKIYVSEVLKKLITYQLSYVGEGLIPNLESNFDLQLFNTFRSYIPSENFHRSLTPHADDRGVFVEIIRSGISGQTSFSTTVPGITRGNHYHTRKVERFAVIKGEALIQLRKVNSSIIHEFRLSGENPSYVDMPVWYTHNIKNIGQEDLITIFWINEPYDPNDPDTYFEKV